MAATFAAQGMAIAALSEIGGEDVDCNLVLATDMSKVNWCELCRCSAHQGNE